MPAVAPEGTTPPPLTTTEVGAAALDPLKALFGFIAIDVGLADAAIPLTLTLAETSGTPVGMPETPVEILGTLFELFGMLLESSGGLDGWEAAVDDFWATGDGVLSGARIGLYTLM